MPTTSTGDDTTIAAEILDTILGRFPSAEQNHVELNLRNTIREFLQKSKSWRTDLTFTTKAGKETYYLNPVDAVSMVAWVGAVYLDGKKVIPAGDTPTDSWYNFRYTDTGGGATRYLVHEASELILIPAPDQDGQQLVVGVSLQIRPGQTAVPDFIGQNFFDGIVCGTAARLYSENMKPYSSKDRADDERKRFLSEVKRARDIANRLYTKGAAGWTFPYFAQGTVWRRGGAS